MKPRVTTDELRRIANLAAEGLTSNAIGKRVGRDPKTVTAALGREEVRQEVEKVRQELADRYEELNHRLLDSIGAEDIQKINAYQRVVSCGILTDKVRLLRGESTANYAVLHAEAVREACNDWGDGHVLASNGDDLAKDSGRSG
ncbi:hypothetical protein GMLC_22700 [Geomonas limicola]|uniref:Transposase IS30-like HTH domain-containing protein n=1 Tax=Geomonas limicola TaxID=2740186 RepID=A0A6V8N872_9BACT|nr:hypothetical protein [Geomonas limicola]GFO68691.1 hypothetical protein GMLC_22700 [Geomonas limicola]